MRLFSFFLQLILSTRVCNKSLVTTRLIKQGMLGIFDESRRIKWRHVIELVIPNCITSEQWGCACSGVAWVEGNEWAKGLKRREKYGQRMTRTRSEN